MLADRFDNYASFPNDQGPKTEQSFNSNIDSPINLTQKQ